MKKLVLIGAMALAACGSDQPPEPVESGVKVNPEAALTTFELVDPDGSKLVIGCENRTAPYLQVVAAEPKSPPPLSGSEATLSTESAVLGQVSLGWATGRDWVVSDDNGTVTSKIMGAIINGETVRFRTDGNFGLPRTAHWKLPAGDGGDALRDACG